MVISIIAAMGQNRVIGKDNALPWKLPADLKHFQELTMGKPVIMGRRTFESLKAALPGRKNIVMAFEKGYEALDCVVVNSLKEALAAALGAEEAMVCGGASVYAQFLPRANRMYLTLIKGDFEGDVYFPEFDQDDWREIERVKNKPDDDNPYEYDFITLEKK